MHVSFKILIKKALRPRDHGATTKVWSSNCGPKFWDGKWELFREPFICYLTGTYTEQITEVNRVLAVVEKMFRWEKNRFKNSQVQYALIKCFHESTEHHELPIFNCVNFIQVEQRFMKKRQTTKKQICAMRTGFIVLAQTLSSHVHSWAHASVYMFFSAIFVYGGWDDFTSALKFCSQSSRQCES